MSDTFIYISTGLNDNYYTLREVCQEKRWTRGEGGVPVPYLCQGDRHLKNLSTNLGAAKAKAEAYAAANNIKLKVLDENISDTRPIDYDTPESKRKAQEDLAWAIIVAEAHEENFNRVRNLKWLEQIEAGKWPFGKYKGLPIDGTDEGYVRYWLENYPAHFDNFASIKATLQSILLAKFPSAATVLPEANGYFLGEAKQRLEIAGTVVAKFQFEGYYGSVNIIKIVASTGELVVYKGTSNLADDSGCVAKVGESIRIKATIKNYEDYKGEFQTIVTRPVRIA